MNEIMFTSCKKIRQDMLNNIHKWYYDKTSTNPIPAKRNFIPEVIQEKYDPEVFIPQEIETSSGLKKEK